MVDALQLIAENKRTKAKFLDLGNCGLTKVPAEVGALVWLRSLSLADQWHERSGCELKQKRSQNHGSSNKSLTDLAPVVSLSGLQALYLSNTQVSHLAPLSGLSALQTLSVSNTQVTDFAPLAGLSALQELQAWSTQVSDLAPLSGLSALQALYVDRTHVSDLAPLAGLSALQTLFVHSTKVRDLSPLSALSALQCLDLADTHVNDLSPLAGLYALQTLYVDRTQVSDLTPLVGLSALLRLDVSDCPLTNPPPEIVNPGTADVLNYLRERAVAGIDHLYEAKLLIVGEGGAGKTSLLRRLYQPGKPLPAESETTRGIEIYPQKFMLKNGQPFRLNVWDFGGQEIYHATHQFFLTRRSLYVLLDDTRKDYKSVQDQGFKYWLELIEVFGGRSRTLIFQNEKDGRSKAIDFEGIQRRYDNVKKLYGGDLAKADAADKMRKGIEDFASNLPHIGDEVPARWLKVRADIEQLAAREPYVSVEKYFEIYGKHIELDESKALHLSGYLHDLGVFLHFQDDLLLKNTVILQNDWVTKAVFRILEDEIIKKALGRFTHEDCARLWKDPAYARMHPQLLALMQNFELCYELRDSRPTTWLVPQMLPPAKPAALAEWSKPEDLVLRYRYDFLPKGMISRLTVRLHRFVCDTEMAWITGVLFQRETTKVLVELLANGAEIELRARGPERLALCSVITADLDALNESFQGLRDKIDKRIPCNCKVCRAETVPEVFFNQKELLYRKEHNKLTVECPRSFEDVDVLELLEGVKAQLPAWANDVPSPSSLHTIRIFLASSSELRGDRDKFELYFRQQNDQLLEKGIYLKIVRWENFLDAMSEIRLQDEYNEAIHNCEVFVSLFFTKTGKFTEEEFDVAHRHFKASGKPLIYTFFKNADIKTGSARKEDLNSLWAFQERLDKLGHFYIRYDGIQDLKRQFRDQLDKLLEIYDPSSGTFGPAKKRQAGA
jgi:hypothetical protein